MAKKAPVKKPKVRAKIKTKIKAKAKPKAAELDLSGFPAESIVTSALGVCLACALDVLTRHVGLSATRAQTEIRQHTPTLAELSAAAPMRPYFAWPADACPYCGAPSKWQASLRIVKIEGGKTTDAARRALVKAVGNSANFAIVEEKSTEREALYSWLSMIGAGLDLDSPEWLLEATRHWLGRRLPKEDWAAIFEQVRYVRRSRRLEEGFEADGQRLYLAPLLFDEVLLVQYLLSRSHKAGGLTFEGRFTLQDIFHRLRRAGYWRNAGVTAGNPADALEQFVTAYGGENKVKFYYVLDRCQFLERLKDLKDARVPKPKLQP